MNHLLAARGLSKSYKDRQVVSSVDLDLKSGEVVGLLGPNGAGKTTSFYMVVGLVRPEQGEVFLDDENLTSLPMHQRARMGISYLPQEASVFRKLTVAQNLMAILQRSIAG
jgi:lipopolysaccharide export system ATP-binding protein